MIVATWNVNGVRARLDRLTEWLDSRSPDVVCLQELKADDRSFPWDDIERAGYTAVANCQKGWNGVAVLARGTGPGTANLIEKGLPGMDDLGARVVSAEAGELKAVSLYVPNGKDTDHDDYQLKLGWLDTLAAYIEATFASDKAVLIAGDFNIVPADIDSYDPTALAGTIFHTEAERSAYRRLIDAGYIDLFRAFDAESPGFSWWDYRGGGFHKNLGLRIDLLLGSPHVAGAVERVWIDRDFRKGPKPSDHAPLMAELAL